MHWSTSKQTTTSSNHSITEDDNEPVVILAEGEVQVRERDKGKSNARF